MRTNNMPVSDLKDPSEATSPDVATAELARPNSTQHYPTIENLATSLSAWLDLIPGGCGGDALADTEALYDEV